MVAGRFRSRKFKRVSTKTPGGKVVLHHEKRKHAKAQCGGCGDYLKGVFTGPLHKMRSVSKTERRPQRPYGGVFCSKCMRKTMVEKAKALVKNDG